MDMYVCVVWSVCRECVLCVCVCGWVGWWGVYMYGCVGGGGVGMGELMLCKYMCVFVKVCVWVQV